MTEGVVLSGRLTINEAEERRGALIALMNQAGERLVLDLSGLEAVDIAGVQLLMALRRSAGKLGKTVTFAKPPEGALMNALSRAGFAGARAGGAPASEWDFFFFGKA